MTQLFEWSGWIAAIAGGASAMYAYFTLRETRRQSNVVRAEKIVSELAKDELLSFAVNRLDWGAGLVQIPPSWREFSNVAFVPFDMQLFKRALLPNFEVSDEPIGMLYRHSFIRLYDHLARVDSLERAGLIDLRDLQAHGWIANQLRDWPYVVESERRTFFLAAIDAWYPGGLTLNLIVRLCNEFPRNDRNVKATMKQAMSSRSDVPANEP